MSPFQPHHGVQHIRRTDEEDGKQMSDFAMVTFLSYTIALLMAVVLTIYLIVYFEPPRKWHWYCRLRRWPVEPGSFSTISTSDTMQTSGADNRNENGNTNHMGSGIWRSVVALVRRDRAGGVRDNESFPSHGIKRTAVFTVRHDPMSIPWAGNSAARAWPFTNERQKVVGSSCGGKFPRTEGNDAADTKAIMQTPPPVQLQSSRVARSA